MKPIMAGGGNEESFESPLQSLEICAKYILAKAQWASAIPKTIQLLFCSSLGLPKS